MILALSASAQGTHLYPMSDAHMEGLESIHDLTPPNIHHYP